MLVLGGGVQGQLLTGALAARGCRVHVADPHPERRERALRFGAAATHEAPRDDAAAAALRRALPGGRGRGRGRRGRRPARGLARRRGARAARAARCCCTAAARPASEVALPTGPLHYQELTLRGSYHHTPGAIREAVASLAAGALPFAELLGEPVGLAEVPAVLERERGAKRPVLP